MHRFDDDGEEKGGHRTIEIEKRDGGRQGEKENYRERAENGLGKRKMMTGGTIQTLLPTLQYKQSMQWFSSCPDGKQMCRLL